MLRLEKNKWTMMIMMAMTMIMTMIMMAMIMMMLIVDFAENKTDHVEGAKEQANDGDQVFHPLLERKFLLAKKFYILLQLDVQL